MKRLTVDAMNRLSDEELMRHIANDRHAAFDTLYSRYAKRAGGFFLRMLSYDREKAEDLVQELFVRVWTNRNTFKAGHSFRTWLYAMAYNLCKNEYRQETVHLAYSEECLKRGEETVEAFDKLENDERYSCLRRAIQALPHEKRDAFLLHYDEELTIAEVSRITDTPEGTVKSRVYAALDIIRKEMDKLK